MKYREPNPTDLIDYLRLPKRSEAPAFKIRLVHVDDVLELEDPIDGDDVLALNTPLPELE